MSPQSYPNHVHIGEKIEYIAEHFPGAPVKFNHLEVVEVRDAFRRIKQLEAVLAEIHALALQGETTKNHYGETGYVFTAPLREILEREGVLHD